MNETGSLLHNKTFLYLAIGIVVVALYVVSKNKQATPTATGNVVTPAADLSSVTDAVSSGISRLLANQNANQSDLAKTLGLSATNNVNALNTLNANLQGTASAYSKALGDSTSQLATRFNQQSDAIGGGFTGLATRFNQLSDAIGGGFTGVATLLNSLLTQMNTRFGTLDTATKTLIAEQDSNNTLLQKLVAQQSSYACPEGKVNTGSGCVLIPYGQEPCPGNLTRHHYFETCSCWAPHKLVNGECV